MKKTELAAQPKKLAPSKSEQFAVIDVKADKINVASMDSNRLQVNETPKSKKQKHAPKVQIAGVTGDDLTM